MSTHLFVTERQMRSGLKRIMDGCPQDEATLIFALILMYFVKRFGGPQDHDVEPERREPNELFRMPPDKEDNPQPDDCSDIDEADWWQATDNPPQEP